MQGFIIQAQLLLAALSAVLPLAPGNRAQLAHVLETVAAALKLGESAVEAGESLATKLAALRSEVERMASLSAHAGADELETAFERVRGASAALRSAYAESALAEASARAR